MKMPSLAIQYTDTRARTRTVVAELLHALGYCLQSNVKTREGGNT
jgi:hypothetical protein